MKYSAVFIAAGMVLLVLALITKGLALTLLWPAADLFLLAFAYGRNEPKWLGKRVDGSLDPLRIFVFAPYFFLTWICWNGYVRLVREAWSHEVAPNLWVGRRPSPRHVPVGALVVDLTAEFSAHKSLIGQEQLLCLPTLDARSPGSTALRKLARRLVTAPHPLYIHCAQGHGRSATLAAVIMVLRGDVSTIEEAIAEMQRIRPLVHLHSVQLRDAIQALAEPEDVQRLRN